LGLQSQFPALLEFAKQQGASPEFTIFAPTDESFQIFEQGVRKATAEQFPDEAEEAFRNVMSFMTALPVARGRYAMEDLKNTEILNSIVSLGSSTPEALQISVEGDDVFVRYLYAYEGSKIIGPSVEASNGVIHVIDGPLIDT